jgi:hypothetical protein
VNGADSGLVGTAVDYLLRSCLRADGIDRTVASFGASCLSAVPGIDRAILLHREVVIQIKQLDPSGTGELYDDPWRRLCELCLILARFEQYRRNPRSPAVQEKVVMPLVDYDGTALGLIPAMEIEEPSIEDLVSLGRVAWSETRDLQNAETLYLNPHFRLSTALGGADADVIHSDTLRDWKSTASAGIVGREELWQLISYALADTEDEYGIRRVEIGALRWRSGVGWPLLELLADLSTGPWEDLADLRRSFADVVAGAGRRT